MQGDKGFPDLVLVRPPRVIFVELKSDSGKLSPDQVDWLTKLRTSSVEAYCWCPSDWDTVYMTLAKDKP